MNRTTLVLANPSGATLTLTSTNPTTPVLPLVDISLGWKTDADTEHHTPLTPFSRQQAILLHDWLELILDESERP